MFIESMFWSFGLIIIMTLFSNVLLSVNYGISIPDSFYLSIGAGIWEEFLFRGICMSIIIYFFRYFFNYGNLFASLIAIIINALLFSLFHYIGQFSDLFTYKNFLSRLIGGIVLSVLYIFRGFGITVYTHIFYDMVIVSFPIIYEQ